MSNPVLHEIEYPESDGKPMAETPLHMRVMWDSIQSLNYWYVDDPDVYVWGNMFLYYVKGDATKAISPDVMVIFGVPKEKDRDIFKTWEEKRKPSAIIEITSKTTKREDLKDKFLLYRDILKVKEYFLFDPRAEYIKQALRGYRLKLGEYLPIAEVDGRLPSKILDLHLQRNGRELRFWDPDAKKWLPTPDEIRANAEAELLISERARENAERDRDFERYKREIAEMEAKLRLQEANIEIERLRRQLEGKS